MPSKQYVITFVLIITSFFNSLAQDVKRDFYSMRLENEGSIGKYILKANSLRISKPDSSLFYLRLALKESIKAKDTALISGTYYSMAFAAKNSLEYNQAITYFDSCIHYSVLKKLKGFSFVSYLQNGNIYTNMKLNDLAIDNMTMAIKYAESENQKMIAYNNIANVYHGSGDRENAIKILNKILDFYKTDNSLKSKNDYVLYAIALGNYGALNKNYKLGIKS